MKKLITTILLFVIVNTNAQIIYTDVSPDFNLTLNQFTFNLEDFFAVDFNSDGIEDFNFTWNSLESSIRLTHSNANNAIIVNPLVSNFGGYFIDILGFGEFIGPFNFIASGSPFPLFKDFFYNNFQNQIYDTYVGVNFEINGQTHYGWILIECVNNNFIIKEYAYQSNSNEIITAGEVDESSNNILVESITIQSINGNTEILVGDSLALETFILPADATDTTIIWSVENQTGIATVNQNGIVFGQAAGTVLVNAITNDGSGNIGQIEVLIASPIFVNNLDIYSINGENQVVLNNTLQIASNILPINPTNDSVNWSVVNLSGYGTIDQNGLFSAQNTGLVYVKASTTDGTNISDSLLIEINDPTLLVDSINVRSIYNIEEVSIPQTLQMIAEVFPNFADDSSINWSVEPITGTANISQDGLLTPLTIGTIKVIASSNDASQTSGEILITILENTGLQNIIVSTESGNDVVDLNDFVQMQVNLIPQEFEYIDIQWTVENQDGSAFINNSGLLSPTSIGFINVIATSLDGSNIQGSKIISIEDLTGINEKFNQNSIYPNPFKNKIFFKENKDIEFVQINSIEGRLIYKGSFKPSIDMSSYNNGLYIVKLFFKNDEQENLMVIKNL